MKTTLENIKPYKQPKFQSIDSTEIYWPFYVITPILLALLIFGFFYCDLIGQRKLIAEERILFHEMQKELNYWKNTAIFLETKLNEFDN